MAPPRRRHLSAPGQVSRTSQAAGPAGHDWRSPLPPASMAVHVGHQGPGAVLRRRLVVAWLVAMVLAALAGWAFWQLPTVLAVILVALDAIGAVVTTALLGLLVAVLSRASVAAGDGWVGFRVLRRWRVVRRVVPDGWDGSGGSPGPESWTDAWGPGPGGGASALPAALPDGSDHSSPALPADGGRDGSHHHPARPGDVGSG